MTEELQRALTEILKGVLSAKDFMLAELPEVVQQLLLWKATMSAIGFVLGLTALIFSFAIWRKTFIPAWKEYNADTRSYYNKDDSFFFYCLLIIPMFIGFLIALHHFDWLQIWLAPKVYLIEYAASLAK